MTGPAPAPDFQSGYEQALRFFTGRAVPTDFELRLLERQAAAVANASRGSGFELQAHIAALRENEDLAKSLYDRAIPLSEDYLFAILRGMSLFQKIGRSDWVDEYFLKYESGINSSPFAMRHAEIFLATSGYFGKAVAMAERMTKSGVPRDEEVVRSACSTYALQEPRDDEQVAELVGFVNRYLFKRRVKKQAVQPSPVVLESGEDTLLITFFVDEPVEEIASLEWEMFGELGERGFPIEESGQVRVVLAPAQDAEDAQEPGTELVDADHNH